MVLFYVKNFFYPHLPSIFLQGSFKFEREIDLYSSNDLSTLSPCSLQSTLSSPVKWGFHMNVSGLAEMYGLLAICGVGHIIGGQKMAAFSLMLFMVPNEDVDSNGQQGCDTVGIKTPWELWLSIKGDL